MELSKPLVAKEGADKVAFINPASLDKKEAKLVKQIDAGHQAEAELTELMVKQVEQSDDYTSATLDINAEKGSHLRVAFIDGVETKDGKVEDAAIITESSNGHLTEAMIRLNESLAEKMAEANEDEEVEA